jgi:hypothetical protein
MGREAEEIRVGIFLEAWNTLLKKDNNCTGWCGTQGELPPPEFWETIRALIRAAGDRNA